MFRTFPLSIIRSFSLYTQQWCMSYRFADSLQAVSKPVWHITLLCVQWKTPDDGQRKCPKHVEFYSKNKFEKLVHLVGFIIRNAFFHIISHTAKFSGGEGGDLIEYRISVLIFLQFLSEKFLILGRIRADLNQTWIFSTNFPGKKNSKYEMSWKSV